MTEKIHDYRAEALISKHLDVRLLGKYIALLQAENKKINLVSRETSDDDLRRLVAESLVALEIIESRWHTYLDIGSGGGIPAVPIILSRQPDTLSILVERRGKKASALSRICLGLNLDVEMVRDSFENFIPTAPIDLITIRLVKLTRPLLNHALGMLVPTGAIVCFSTTVDVTAKCRCEVASHHYRLDGCEAAKTISVIRRN